MERAFDRELADRIRAFTGDLGGIVRAMIAENRELKGENARLKAKLQGVKDQVADVEETVPNSDEIAARGSAHKAVNADIRETAERLENGIAEAQPIKTSRGLSMLLQGLRNQNQPYRHPLSAESLPEFHDTPKVSQA